MLSTLASLTGSRPPRRPLLHIAVMLDPNCGLVLVACTNFWCSFPASSHEEDLEPCPPSVTLPAAGVAGTQRLFSHMCEKSRWVPATCTLCSPP